MSHFAMKSGLSSGRMWPWLLLSEVVLVQVVPLPCGWIALGLVSSFTLGRRMLASSSWNDRSSIGRTGLLLCGIAASGLIFRLLGMFSLSSSHGMSHARLALSFSNVLA